MKRRELVRRIAGSFTTLSISPALAGLVAGYAPAANPAQANPGPGIILNPAQLALLRALTDCVIPATDTPGAVEAGVPAFIDYLLAHGYTKEEQARFRAGLAALEEAAQLRNGRLFGDTPRQRQLQLLVALEQEHQQVEAAGAAAAFCVWMKELTVLGYYTSEIGATQELKYLPVPGAYTGCIDFSEAGRTWAL